MGDIVGLGRFRKARARDERAAQAAVNRVAFGRTGPEKKAARIEAERRRRELDGARRD